MTPTRCLPLQAALGYNLTQTLFVGTNNVVVEGVTDYWYLTAVSDHLEPSGRSLPKELVLTPAGGAAKVGYMVALLAAQKLDVVVVLDSDTAGDEACKELLRSKLVRDSSVVRIRDAHDAPGPEADIEDLLVDSVFAALAKEAYKKELQGKQLALNANIPRVARRYEEAFAALGLEFNKSRVAKLFVSKLGTAKTASAVIDATVEDRFARLFANIAIAMQKTAGRGPFKT